MDSNLVSCLRALGHSKGKEFGKAHRVLIAKSQVLLAVALGDFNGVVDVVDGHSIVSDVFHQARPTATLEIGGQCGGNSWPNLDTGTIL